MQVRLSQILSSLESGGRPKGGASLDSMGIPSLGAEHLDSNGGFNFKSVKFIPEEYFNGLKNGIIEKEDILIVKDGATTGKVSFICNDFPFGKAAVNEHVFLLKIDKSKASPKFAFHYLKCPQGQKDIMKDFRGATVGGISKGFVDFVKFELPSIPIQLHIANILSEAENLIAQRKESIRLLDEFLKSTFLEMFGDPVRNEKGWDVNTLNSVISGIDSGWSPNCLKGPRNSDLEWAILKLGCVTSRRFIPEENKLLDQSIKIKKELVPRKGDLLFSRKNTYELVGATAYVFENYEKLLLPDTIFRINYLKNRVSGFYLWFLFNDNKFRKVIQTLASGSSGSMPNISKDKLNKLNISIPPLELQTQFAQVVEKAEALKAQYQQSLRELENLYGSLSQRAFRGELGTSEEKPTVAVS